ncbi:hypothetical protein [Pediococcus pentosaceus]|uniref:hypothetical protein n=1 Tax=Pediococcus pentosaceus TaxID=1255 RepID=UPI000B4B60F1|nr:hypothetical protein [Pediococcus pentosaceus]ASC08427.1 hypothetical protein S100194_00888 [Pediococcus pentosaceus]WFC00999.1 hypothetical protein O9Z69_00325 [Pediococcus pentosaceus]
MTKDEYVKTLEKVAADKVADAKHDDYYAGYSDALQEAISLAERLDELSVQKKSDIEIKNCLSYAGYADLAYNERVINGIESVLIQLGYEVEDD